VCQVGFTYSLLSSYGGDQWGFWSSPFKQAQQKGEPTGKTDEKTR